MPRLARRHLHGGRLRPDVFAGRGYNAQPAKQGEVVVITDACRAGKLAGSSINGAQLTSANLAKQFADEVKILSCQPTSSRLKASSGATEGACSASTCSTD
ncbi:MAG: hypothetical protein IPM82_28020 [Saprospiraceae bacterium]|nr:hypothetical protein [Saprospiraceae bacterium]